MKRVLIVEEYLHGRVASVEYLCRGNNCSICKFRFECFTSKGRLKVQADSVFNIKRWLKKQTCSMVEIFGIYL